MNDCADIEGAVELWGFSSVSSQSLFDYEQAVKRILCTLGASYTFGTANIRLVIVIIEPAEMSRSGCGIFRLSTGGSVLQAFHTDPVPEYKYGKSQVSILL